MVAVKKRLRAVLTFCLVCLAAPAAAQLGSATPTPATTDKTATPSATAPEARSPNAKISQNLAQRRIGLVCSIYAGKFDWWTLTLRITQYSTMGLAENCDEQHFDSLTLASMEAQLRAVQQPCARRRTSLRDGCELSHPTQSLYSNRRAYVFRSQ